MPAGRRKANSTSYQTTSGALLYDADGSGSGAAVHFATLNNKPNLNAGDLLALG